MWYIQDPGEPYLIRVCPIVRDGPANINLQNICFAISYVNCFPALLRLPNHKPISPLFSFRMIYKLQLPDLSLGISDSYDTPTFLISIINSGHFLLLSCLMIIRLLAQIKELRKGGGKLFSKTPQYKQIYLHMFNNTQHCCFKCICKCH